MMTIETIRFHNDTQTRKRLMVPESFQHPAKGQLGMWALMVERYSQPGDLVLDPMAGSGATLLAALMGRNVICVELEQHFVEPMRQSWAKMRTMPMLGHEMGQAVILRGDARCLPLPDASVGAAITSPPFGDTNARSEADQAWRDKAIATGRLPSMGKGLSESVRYTRPVDAIVTSPPWEDKTALQDSQWLHSHEAELAERFRQNHMGEKGLPGNTKPERRTTMSRYTKPPQKDKHCACGCSHPNSYEGCPHFVRGYNQRCAVCDHGAECHKIPSEAILVSEGKSYDGQWTSRTYRFAGHKPSALGADNDDAAHPGDSAGEAVDSIITSPPYEAEPSIPTSPNRLAEIKYVGVPYKDERANHEDMRNLSTGRYERAHYENIGNLRNAAYWDAMRLVYQECFRVLKPGGILALVLKGFTRDGKYVDLPGQTEALLLEAGWQKHDHWRRELWSLSFWRILQKRRDPAAWDNRLMYETDTRLRCTGLQALGRLDSTQPGWQAWKRPLGGSARGRR